MVKQLNSVSAAYTPDPIGMDDFDKFYTKEILLNCRKCGAEDIFDPEEMIPGFWD